MADTLSDITENEFDDLLLQEVDIVPERPRGFGITMKELADAKGTTPSTARNAAEKKVDAKEWEKIEMRNYTGQTSWVYFKAGSWPVKKKG